MSMRQPGTNFRVGDVVLTPLGERAQIMSFKDGRADVRYFNENGKLGSEEHSSALIMPRLLKFFFVPHNNVWKLKP